MESDGTVELANQSAVDRCARSRLPVLPTSAVAGEVLGKGGGNGARWVGESDIGNLFSDDSVYRQGSGPAYSKNPSLRPQFAFVDRKVSRLKCSEVL